MASPNDIHHRAPQYLIIQRGGPTTLVLDGFAKLDGEPAVDDVIHGPWRVAEPDVTRATARPGPRSICLANSERGYRSRARCRAGRGCRRRARGAGHRAAPGPPAPSQGSRRVGVDPRRRPRRRGDARGLLGVPGARYARDRWLCRHPGRRSRSGGGTVRHDVRVHLGTAGRASPRRPRSTSHGSRRQRRHGPVSLRERLSVRPHQHHHPRRAPHRPAAGRLRCRPRGVDRVRGDDSTWRSRAGHLRRTGRRAGAAPTQLGVFRATPDMRWGWSIPRRRISCRASRARCSKAW